MIFIYSILRSDETIESSISDTEGNETPPRDKVKLGTNPNLPNSTSEKSESVPNVQAVSQTRNSEIEVSIMFT